jgi:hypothetical protein
VPERHKSHPSVSVVAPSLTAIYPGVQFWSMQFWFVPPNDYDPILQIVHSVYCYPIYYPELSIF